MSLLLLTLPLISAVVVVVVVVVIVIVAVARQNGAGKNRQLERLTHGRPRCRTAGLINVNGAF